MRLPCKQKVKPILKAVNVKKATGLDGIPGRVLQDCAHQLAEVFTDIFSLFLVNGTVLACLKTAIPVPKQTNVSTLNDYIISLLAHYLKCFKRLVLGHIKSTLFPALDQYEYAYSAKRSTRH